MCVKTDHGNFRFLMSRRPAHYQSYKNPPKVVTKGHGQSWAVDHQLVTFWWPLGGYFGGYLLGQFLGLFLGAMF